MKNKVDERRKVRFVKMQFQMGFIFKFFGLIILSSLIISAIVYSLSTSSSTTVFTNSRLQIKSTADFLWPLLCLSSLIAVLVSGVATVIMTFIISHRIAGPLYRMEKYMTQVKEGDLGVNIRVRQKDQLQNLAGSLNQMLGSLRNTIMEINKEVTAISPASLSAKEQERLENIKNLLKKFKY